MEPKVQQRCHRCAGGTSIPCGDFAKIFESINAGLVLYDYVLHAKRTNSERNIFILQNTKDVELPSWNSQRSFENCKNACPRCIYIYKHAKRLMKNITLGKRKTLGVCSNCGFKIQTDPSHCKCNVIFKKFLISSAKDLYVDDHNSKTDLAKPNRFITSFFKNEPENNRLKLQTHSYSDSYLNRASKKYYEHRTSQKPADGHQVEIRPLIQSEIELSKLYITRTCHSFLQVQKALSPGQKASPTENSRSKTRLRLRKQSHDQTIQFHFIFPSEKEDLKARLQVSSSQLLHDIQAKYNRTKILEVQRSRGFEMKNHKAKTNKQTLPWQSDFSILSLKGKSLELLHDIRTKYRETKILEDNVLEERRSRDFENKNLGVNKTNKQTLPWQRDSSPLSLKENLERLHDIQAKYENKKRQSEEQLFRDLQTKNDGVKTKKRRFSWQKDSSHLNVEAKYEEKKRQLEEQRNIDLEKNIPGANTKNHGLPWHKDSSHLNLEAKNGEKQKKIEKQRSSDLEKKNLGAKSKKQGLPWQHSSLLKLETKYEEKQKHSEKQRSKDLVKTKLGAKTKDNGFPWQKESSVLHLEAKYEEKQSILEEQRNRDLEKKKNGAKTNKHGLPWQKDSSVLSIEVKYDKKKRRLEDQLSRDLKRVESKNLGAKTKKYKLPWQKGIALSNLEEETGTITQANVIIDEKTKSFKKKKDDLNKKDDGFNERNDGNNEKNDELLRITSLQRAKAIEERIKKNQAALEMITRADENIGVIRFTLSDQKLDMEWTGLPTEKAVRKINIYRMRLSHPEFDWFAKNKDKRKIFYDSGETLAEFSEDGRGRWFYRDGKLALDYYNTEKTTPGRRYVVYSSGQPDKKGRLRPQTILAAFDHSGNAVVFDHIGNIRLKYDQSEGVVLDPSIGPMSHWKWHSLNDPPATIDTEMPVIDPQIQNMSEADGPRKETEPTDDDQGMFPVFKNSVKDKSKNITQSYKPFEIKMKALKINENFSLKILDQTIVYLIYRDGTTHIKINIGMTLNQKEVVDIETCNVGEIFNPLEKFPARTQSIVALQRTVAQAREAERARVRRLGRLRPPFVS